MNTKLKSSNDSKQNKPSTNVKIATLDLAKQHQNVNLNHPDERHRMIAEAAYLIAEQRNFKGDLAFDDWLQAEAEIDGLDIEHDW